MAGGCEFSLALETALQCPSCRACLTTSPAPAHALLPCGHFVCSTCADALVAEGGKQRCKSCQHVYKPSAVRSSVLLNSIISAFQEIKQSYAQQSSQPLPLSQLCKAATAEAPSVRGDHNVDSENNIDENEDDVIVPTLDIPSDDAADDGNNDQLDDRREDHEVMSEDSDMEPMPSLRDVVRTRTTSSSTMPGPTYLSLSTLPNQLSEDLQDGTMDSYPLGVNDELSRSSLERLPPVSLDIISSCENSNLQCPSLHSGVDSIFSGLKSRLMREFVSISGSASAAESFFPGDRVFHDDVYRSLGFDAANEAESKSAVLPEGAVSSSVVASQSFSSSSSSSKSQSEREPEEDDGEDWVERYYLTQSNALPHSPATEIRIRSASKKRPISFLERAEMIGNDDDNDGAYFPEVCQEDILSPDLIADSGRDHHNQDIVSKDQNAVEAEVESETIVHDCKRLLKFSQDSRPASSTTIGSRLSSGRPSPFILAEDTCPMDDGNDDDIDEMKVPYIDNGGEKLNKMNTNEDMNDDSTAELPGVPSTASTDATQFIDNSTGDDIYLAAGHTTTERSPVERNDSTDFQSATKRWSVASETARDSPFNVPTQLLSTSANNTPSTTSTVPLPMSTVSRRSIDSINFGDERHGHRYRHGIDELPPIANDLRGCMTSALAQAVDTPRRDREISDGVAVSTSGLRPIDFETASAGLHIDSPSSRASMRALRMMEADTCPMDSYVLIDDYDDAIAASVTAASSDNERKPVSTGLSSSSTTRLGIAEIHVSPQSILTLQQKESTSFNDEDDVNRRSELILESTEPSLALDLADATDQEAAVADKLDSPCPSPSLLLLSSSSSLINGEPVDRQPQHITNPTVAGAAEASSSTLSAQPTPHPFNSSALEVHQAAATATATAACTSMEYSSRLANDTITIANNNHGIAVSRLSTRRLPSNPYVLWAAGALSPSTTETITACERKDWLSYCGVITFDLKSAAIDADADKSCGLLIMDTTSPSKPGLRLVDRTVKYLMAMCCGMWIVSGGWLKDSIKAGALLDYSRYEINGSVRDVSYGGPASARRTWEQTGRSGLLASFVFVLVTGVPTDTLGAAAKKKPSIVNETSISWMIRKCGGCVIYVFATASELDNLQPQLWTLNTTGTKLMALSLVDRQQQPLQGPRTDTATGDLSAVDLLPSQQHRVEMLSVNWLFDAISQQSLPLDSRSYRCR